MSILFSTLQKRMFSMTNAALKTTQVTKDKKESPAPPRGKPGRRPGVVIKTAHDVRRLLSRLTNQVLREEANKDTLRVVAYAATVILKSIEQGQLTDRIAELERIVQKRTNMRGSEQNGNTEK
jgi:hypothetical protein